MSTAQMAALVAVLCGFLTIVITQFLENDEEGEE
jgi:hypothetical protein